MDAYNSSYPLSYKHAFRKIISGALKKGEKLRKYFDSWGSRCHVLSAELENSGFLITKDSGPEIDDLSFNADTLRTLGGSYILSAVPIRNAEITGLKFLRSFENASSPWRIWLYGAPPMPSAGSKADSS